MARKKRRSHMNAGELNLTAMIDVAFQLLSFFIMTMKPTDVLAQLDISRPAPDKRAMQQTKPINVIWITILADGSFVLNELPIKKDKLELQLTQLGALDKTQTVIVACTPKSSHGKMVEVLDLCAKAGLESLSVVSID
jgi:biopolymer transport protein ExbD